MRLTIFDIENWKEIGATLARNKTRTFLTGFGIFWGTAMLAILLGGARGAKDMLMRKTLDEESLVSLLQPLLSLLPGKINKKVQKVRRMLFAGKDR